MSKTSTKFSIGVDDKTKAKLNRISKNFKQMGKDVEKVGRSLSMSVTAPLALMGAASLRTAGNFEASMNRVRAISGVAGDSLVQMTDQAKELGRTTQFSASEAADAMGFLAMAGFEVNDVMGAMPSTLQLAAAAQIDLAKAADISSNILTGFGLDVADLGHANDVLIKTTQSTNTNLEQLGEAMAYVAPVASAMGMSIEETTAALGLFGNAGIQGSMAGTSLRGALTALANPTAEVASLMRDLGINAFDSNGQMLPFKDTIDKLAKSGATAGEMMEIFGKRSGPAMMALVRQGSGALEELTTQLENSGGAAQKAANIQMEGFNGAIKKMKSAFEGLQIAIGDSGLLDYFTKFIGKSSELISKMASVDKNVMKSALAFAGITASIGPALFLFGKMIQIFPTIHNGFFNMIKTLKNLKFAFAAVSGTAMLWVAGIALALGAMLVIWANWGDNIKSFLSNMWSGITKGWNTFTDWLTTNTEKGLEAVSKAWKWLSDGIVSVMKPVLNWIGDAYSTVINGVMGLMGGFVTYLSSMSTKLGNALNIDTLKEAGEKLEGLGATLKNTEVDIPEFAGALLGKLKSGVDGGVDYITGVDWGDKWSGLKEGFSSQSALVKQQFTDMLDSLGMADLKKMFETPELAAVTATPNSSNDSFIGPQEVNLLPEEQTTLDQLERIKLVFTETFGELRSFGTQTAEIISQSFSNTADALSSVMGDALGDVMTNMLGLTEGPIMIGRAFKNMAIGIIKDLAGMIAKMLIVSLIAKALGFTVGPISMSAINGGETLAGARAMGGPVGLGKTYLVGEKGPELFTAPRNGNITPNNELGGNTYHNEITINANGDMFTDPLALRRLAETLNDELNKVQSTYYSTA